MFPFCSCSGTGPQVTRMRLELMASAVTFSGAPDGTAQTGKKKSHSLIAQCLNTRPEYWVNSHGLVTCPMSWGGRQQTALACEQQTRVWAWGDSEQTTERLTNLQHQATYHAVWPAQNIHTCGLLATQIHNDSPCTQTSFSDYGHPSTAFQMTINVEVCNFWTTSGTKWNCNMSEWHN